MEGTLYDGATAYPHSVRVEVRDDGLDLSTESGWTDRIPGSVLKRLDSSGGTVRLSRTDGPGWRLTLPKEAADTLAPLLGREEHYGRWIDRIGLAPAAIGFGAIAAAIVAIGYLAPEWVAPHVPRSWERNLGSAIVGDFGDLRCRDAKGQKALEALVERVAPGATTGPDALKVAALDVDMFNAAALPGGYIVVFKGAIDEVSDADALAGIMAHEVAHVRRRHVTEALIRELGIGALIRLFAGDVGANAEQIVSLSYTRGNETEADGDAIHMLTKAGISPRPTGQLFEQLSKEYGDGYFYSAEFLQSHPLSGKRAKRFANAERKGTTYGHALSDEQFDALKLMCRDSKGD